MATILPSNRLRTMIAIKPQTMQKLTLIFVALAATLPTVPATVQAEHRVLHSEMTHLRSGDRREWSGFPEQASGSELRVQFSAEANQSPQTLGLRRVDVKEGWAVKLNGELLGRLFSDENDMEEVWQLEPAALQDGANELVVEATGDDPDDVRIGEIWLDPQPREDVFNEARLQLTASDEQGEPIPCRFTILNEHGSLAVVGAESNDSLAVRSGVVYSSTGTADVGVRSGDYTILCGRGFEYSLNRVEITAAAGDRQQHEFSLRRVVDTEGLAACDPHIHTYEVSRHGDASLTERMITLAGEGIELAVATDHNVFVDYRPHLERLGLADAITPVIGNEVTTRSGHVNIFPAEKDAPLPDHRTNQWDALFADVYETPNVRVAILNHPRDVHSGFTPLGPKNMIAAVGERRDGRVLKANAMELINSAALQSDPMVLFHDWLTQLNRGLELTAVGTSDSHEVSRKIVGQGRSYVAVDDSDPGAIDVDAAVESFVRGRVRVSLGLLTELTVDGQAQSGDRVSATGEAIDVAIRVQGPEWTQADRVELYANGRRIRSKKITEEQGRAAGEKALVRWKLDRPAHDVHLVALARGPGVTGLHWPIAKPYQPSSPEWNPYVFGCSGAVRIDADGDNQWTCAKEYAKRSIDSADGDFEELIATLGRYDAATAAFAAHLWTEAGGQIRGEAAQRQLSGAPAAVREGFERYIHSQRASLKASHER